jgi:hypothetical protein
VFVSWISLQEGREPTAACGRFPTEDVVSEFGVVRQHVRRLVLWLVVLKRCLNIEEAVSRLRRREVRDRSSGLSKALGWVVDALRREE